MGGARPPARKQKCGRIKSTTGKRCDAWAMTDQDVCGAHGGRSPQARAKAKERGAERAIAGALGKLQIVPVHDPLTALAELAGEILAWKQLAAEKVAELKSMERENHLAGNEEVRASILVFERAMDRAVTVLATIARLNIDERLTKISEQQAELVKTALMKALGDVGMTREQQREATTHLARHLRLVAG